MPTTNTPPDGLAKAARELALSAAAGKFLDTVRNETQQAIAGFSAQQKGYELKHAALLVQWAENERALAELRAEIIRRFGDWNALLCDTVCRTKQEIALAEAELARSSKAVEVPAQLSIMRRDQRRQATKDRFASWSKPAETLEKAFKDSASEIQQLRLLLEKPEKINAIYRFWVRVQPGHYANAPEAEWKSYEAALDSSGNGVPGKGPWERFCSVCEQAKQGGEKGGKGPDGNSAPESGKGGQDQPAEGTAAGGSVAEEVLQAGTRQPGPDGNSAPESGKGGQDQPDKDTPAGGSPTDQVLQAGTRQPDPDGNSAPESGKAGQDQPDKDTAAGGSPTDQVLQAGTRQPDPDEDDTEETLPLARAVYLVDPPALAGTLLSALEAYKKAGVRHARRVALLELHKADFAAAKKRLEDLRKGEEEDAKARLQQAPRRADGTSSPPGKTLSSNRKSDSAETFAAE